MSKLSASLKIQTETRKVFLECDIAHQRSRGSVWENVLANGQNLRKGIKKRKLMFNAHTFNKQWAFEYIIDNCRKSSHYYVEIMRIELLSYSDLMAVLEMYHEIWIATINKDIAIYLISNRHVPQRYHCRKTQLSLITLIMSLLFLCTRARVAESYTEGPTRKRL